MELRRMKGRAVWLNLLVLITAAGCGPSDDVEVYPVRGRITFNGKPMVGGGSIAFYPLGSQAGKAPGGLVNEDGTYGLTTYTDGDGSMPGEFRVVIVQVTVKEGAPTADGVKAPAAAIPTVSEADRIPAIYSDPYNSPLTATVEAKELNEINFDLARQPGAG
jgi:hypothetical protein